MNHKQVAAMKRFLALHADAPAEALCAAFDFATKGTLKPLKTDIAYFVKEKDGGEGDPEKCCILEICC